jgi:septal ring factor EnvC (AmiA/AmiB activator)
MCEAGRRAGGQAGSAPRKGTARLVRCALAFVIALAAFPPARLPAQQDLEDSRRRLEEVRRERNRLEQERNRLQGQVHDLGAEVENLERQRQTTNRIVNELDAQIGGLNGHVDQSSADLVLTQDNLAEKRAVLTRRLAEIYKRGTLYTFEVLVAAQSFGDLLSRYKYLYLQSTQDKALVDDVEKLARQVERRRREIIQVRSQLDRSKEEREAELRRYGRLMEERGARLREARRSSRTNEQQLSAVQRDEARLSDLLATLEARARARRPAGAAAPATPGTITTADIGKLDWPVEGSIIFGFGPERLSSGATVRHNGIAIGADAGTPIKAVEAGTVELVQNLGTYGLTLIVAHGNGYRSIYANLKEAKLTLGASVAKGQVVGTVGGENTDEGAHLYFEIRGERGIALDPTDWLKRRR